MALLRSRLVGWRINRVRVCRPSGMILAQGAIGPGFNSWSSPRDFPATTLAQKQPHEDIEAHHCGRNCAAARACDSAGCSCDALAVFTACVCAVAGVRVVLSGLSATMLVANATQLRSVQTAVQLPQWV